MLRVQLRVFADIITSATLPVLSTQLSLLQRPVQLLPPPLVLLLLHVCLSCSPAEQPRCLCCTTRMPVLFSDRAESCKYPS
jgi:hypothetical protein